MRLSVEGFYKSYDNYPLSVADGLSIASKGTNFGQVGDEQIVSTGKGRAYGVEFLYRIMEMGKLNLTATYTYFRSEFTNSAGVYLPSSWDTRNLFNLIASYKFKHDWNVAIRWRFVGGAPYTPINDVSYSKSVWDITNQPVLDYSKFNSLQLPNTHQLDLRIDKEFYFKKWVLNLYTDIQNAYNFKTQGAPIYTNISTTSTLDAQGNKVYLPVTDPSNPSKYVLRTIDNFAGTILPTIGLIIKF
jgi:outer membrane receptor for ferrienterochelin and colicin